LLIELDQEAGGEGNGGMTFAKTIAKSFVSITY